MHDHPPKNPKSKRIVSDTYRSVLREKPVKRHHNLLETSFSCARAIHKGEPLKYVDGPYYRHVRDVARRMASVSEKVVALLHDTVESELKRRLEHLEENSKEKTLFKDEEAIIALILKELTEGFALRGHDISFLIPDIDVLTKRTADKANYRGYIARVLPHPIAAKVKLADLEDNMDPERNPPSSKQKPKDKERLERYAWAKLSILAAYPSLHLKDPRDEKLVKLQKEGRRSRKRSDSAWRRELNDNDGPRPIKKRHYWIAPFSSLFR